jgi:hypothetical protein
VWVVVALDCSFTCCTFTPVFHCFGHREGIACLFRVSQSVSRTCGENVRLLETRLICTVSSYTSFDHVKTILMYLERQRRLYTSEQPPRQGKYTLFVQAVSLPVLVFSSLVDH